MTLFLSIFAVFSLHGEYVRFPLTDGVFLPSDHGLDFFTSSPLIVVVVVVVVFTLKTILTSIQYPSLSYSSRQRNEFPWSHANPK